MNIFTSDKIVEFNRLPHTHSGRYSVQRIASSNSVRSCIHQHYTPSALCPDIIYWLGHEGPRGPSKLWLELEFHKFPSEIWSDKFAVCRPGIRHTGPLFTSDIILLPSPLKTLSIMHIILLDSCHLPPIQYISSLILVTFK